MFKVLLCWDGWMDGLLMACVRSNICECRTRSWTWSRTSSKLSRRREGGAEARSRGAITVGEGIEGAGIAEEGEEGEAGGEGGRRIRRWA